MDMSDLTQMSRKISDSLYQALVEAGVLGCDLTSDSRAVKPGMIFAAYPGSTRDGRDFIAQAVQAGAAAVLYESNGAPNNLQPLTSNIKYSLIAVKGLREQVSAIAALSYGEPSQQLWMVGVTGTNGKTSTSNWIAQTLDTPDARSAVIGTIGNGLVGELQAATHTTPDAIVLQRTLKQLYEMGAKQVAMEVSSHALDQARVNAVKFDIAVFTNLTRDHLDYHGTMEAYGEAKARLFTIPNLCAAVINADDAFGQVLLKQTRAELVIAYGIDSGDLRASDIQMSLAGTEFTLSWRGETVQVLAPVVGTFNVQNLLAVAGVLIARGEKLRDVAIKLGALEPVRGRMQLIQPTQSSATPIAVVDYAHTPDALEKALLALRPALKTGHRLICVFGCGGDRDKGKRSVMGKIAANLADFTVITSDNPRTESADSIINDIKAGIADVDASRWIEEPDRAAAIRQAIATALPEDIVLIAGKGHEDYQDVNGQRQHFDDSEHALIALNTYGSTNRSVQ